MRLGIFRDWLKRVGAALSRRGVDEALLAELEEALIAADVNVYAVDQLLERLREEARAQRLQEFDQLRALLRQILREWLGEPEPLREHPTPPTLYLFVGVNGVGKTTTIAKLAYMLQRHGKRVLLAAGDTFRAAAIDQLQIWADRLGTDIVKHREGADPSAVVFDAIQAARARGIDFVLADTAGRQHTAARLMEELKRLRGAAGDRRHRGSERDSAGGGVRSRPAAHRHRACQAGQHQPRRRSPDHPPAARYPHQAGRHGREGGTSPAV